jgi:3-phenylpropionate/trans-cinnamate dioxygenase ferredoxin reductase subunit
MTMRRGPRHTGFRRPFLLPVEASTVADQNGVVIVGAGLAAAIAAETLRSEGYVGRILVIGAEPEPPYERPPLSKGYLLGSSPREAIYVHEPEWYDAHGVELVLGTRVAELDLTGRAVVTAAGQRIGFDSLLLATGAVPHRLHAPGAEADGVHYLRSAEEADRLRAALEAGSRQVVVVGAGWIGLETAAAARTYGNQVTIVDPQPTPLHRVLGPELGETFAALHRDHDVSLRVNTGVVAFRTSGSHLHGVITTRGELLPADLAIVGVGVRPAVELAEAAGLPADNGVLVDAALRSANHDVHAAGDVANAVNPLLGRRIRVEHWQNARTSGAVAARSMLGQQVRHDPVPYFFTDQYDVSMEYAGHTWPGGYDRVVIRGELAAQKFLAFWLSNDRVVAGMNVNVWDVNQPIQKLIRSRRPVDAQLLADPDIPLDQLVTPEGNPR